MNKSFGETVQEARISEGLTQAQLADRTKLGQGTISRIEQNIQKNLTDETKNALIRALGERYFQQHIQGLSGAPSKYDRPIPVISWIHAGAFAECYDIWPVGVSGEGDPVYSYVAAGPNAFGLRVEGDSMMPRFMPGDIAIIDPAIKCDNGSACAISVNGEASLKLFWDRENEIILRPMNDKYPETVIKKDSKVDFRVIGKVVDIKAKI